MVSRVAAVVLAVLAIVLAGYVFRPASQSPTARPINNGAQLPEVELAEPEPAPILFEPPNAAQPVALAVDTEPVPAPLMQMPADDEMVRPARGLTTTGSATQSPEPATADSIEASEPVLYADGAADTSLRNADFPNTYISHIEIDLTSPQHEVRLTWSGRLAARQKRGPFHSSPGAGLGYNNCNDIDESNRPDSNCTPKGEFAVEAFSDYLNSYPNCRYVTWIHTSRGVAMHSHPQVPSFPASHGCVRLDESAAQLIHNNSLIGKTKVTIGGTWTR